MKKILIISALIFFVSLRSSAKTFVQEISSQDFYWTEILLFFIALLSISYFSIGKFDKPTKVYKMFIVSPLAGIFGGVLGIISIYSTNINCSESNIIILSGALTGMFLAMVLCSSYRSVGIFMGALIGFILGSISSTATIFHRIPWNIVVLGTIFVSTNILIMNYRLKKAYN